MKAAETQLSRSSAIYATQSEAYLELLPNWLPTSELSAEAHLEVNNLAIALEKDHDDPWLEEFLRTRTSSAAQIALRTAINDNIKGDHQHAIAEALAASEIFKKSGNAPGFLRSALEVIYGLRRQSKATECLHEFSSLTAGLAHSNYHWLSLRILIEGSGCLAMNNQFDEAWHAAQNAAELASHTGYDALHLRALGYLGSFDTVEGRLRQAWLMDEAGLGTFWNGTFADDRGYQFYADLESGAERAQQWNLAVALESEAVAQFQKSPRLDFEALARCHLSQLLEITGDLAAAQTELNLSGKAFEKLPQNATTSLYRADCDLVAAAYEARHGSTESAQEKLAQIEKGARDVGNFTVRLRLEKAWADVERSEGSGEEEAKHLRSAIAIAQAGFASLKSAKDRWDWRHEVNEIYHRLLELELTGPHHPEDTYADWESFRSVESPPSPNRKHRFFGNVSERKLVSSRLGMLRDSSVVGFMMFPQWITAWVADDRGVREFRISIGSAELRHQVLAFYDLCSTRETPLEKVKDAGSRLYRLLFQPLAGSLDGRETLFIEADQILSRIPWPALVAPDGRYLGELKAIVNTPGVLYAPVRKREKRLRNKMLVAYPGPATFQNITYAPLPQARAEADYVAGLYPGTKFLQNADASAAELANELPESAMFHFAGHATTREDNGELVTQGAAGGDILSASRLESLNLSNLKLVALSACSAAGESEPTQDAHGLVNAFLTSGVNRVIATEWDVDSARTATLMRAFYVALKTNSKAEQALKQAWHQLASDLDTRHPYYWSAFEAFGLVE